MGMTAAGKVVTTEAVSEDVAVDLDENVVVSSGAQDADVATDIDMDQKIIHSLESGN